MCWERGQAWQMRWHTQVMGQRCARLPSCRSLTLCLAPASPLASTSSIVKPAGQVGTEDRSGCIRQTGAQIETGISCRKVLCRTAQQPSPLVLRFCTIEFTAVRAAFNVSRGRPLRMKVGSAEYSSGPTGRSGGTAACAAGAVAAAGIDGAVGGGGGQAALRMAEPGGACGVGMGAASTAAGASAAAAAGRLLGSVAVADGAAANLSSAGSGTDAAMGTAAVLRPRAAAMACSSCGLLRSDRGADCSPRRAACGAAWEACSACRLLVVVCLPLPPLAAVRSNARCSCGSAGGKASSEGARAVAGSVLSSTHAAWGMSSRSSSAAGREWITCAIRSSVLSSTSAPCQRSAARLCCT